MGEPASSKLGNAPEFAVSELAGALKRTLEDNFSFVRVRGEITGFRGVHTSGHAYFGLKDANARIDAVVWRTALSRLRTKPTEGLEVIASGRITTFPAKSSYQLIVEALEPAGIGALMALLETRRRHLTAEGLFDAARKRTLPFLPRTVGVVTSPTGAVIRDILHRLSERFPVRVLVWPIRVQGEGAAEEIVRAIRGMSEMRIGDRFPRPDVVIVARGGGSLEDLWAFNEEDVVRAAAECKAPLISAIGHETDWTLIDHAADVRAPTPTAAAELCVPVRKELLSRLSAAETRHIGALQRVFRRNEMLLRAAERALASKKDLLSRRGDRLHACAASLVIKLHRRHDRLRLDIARCSERLRRFEPRMLLARAVDRDRRVGIRLRECVSARLAGHRGLAESAGQKLRIFLVAKTASEHRRTMDTRQRWLVTRFAMKQDLRDRSTSLSRESARTPLLARRKLADLSIELRHHAAVLRASSHESVLRRGFAIVRDANRVVAPSAAECRDRPSPISIEFHDGEVSASFGIALARKSRRSRKLDTVGQQQLL